MVSGIGIDLLKISQIEAAISDPNDPFIRKTYTEKELALIQSRPNPRCSFATRFAGKEAVFKSLSLYGDAIRLNEIEILENEVGQPTVSLHGNALQSAKRKGIGTILISLSFDGDYAIAYATALECEETHTD